MHKPQTLLPLRAIWLGSVPYDDAYRLQLDLLEQRHAGAIPDTLLLLEHPHVYTLGRRGVDDDILATVEELAASGAQVVHTDRGGQTTYHGPGQLVGYPIIDLRAAKLGPVAYVRALEDTLIDLLERLGVEAHRVDGKTGVWTYGSLRPDLAPPLEAGEAKIAAIGVRISRGIAMHGFALNVATDLRHFDRIIPCGMPDVRMASVQSICSQAPPIDQVAGLAGTVFGRRFHREVRTQPPEALAA